MATPINTGMAHKYHLVLADGSERDLTAYSYRIEANGALSLYASNEDKIASYAEGQWHLIEQERKDDRG